MKKGWFRKILDWIPDFPGISPASKEFELIDLKNPGKPPRKSRMAGKLLLLFFGTIGTVLIWINTIFNTQQRAVAHVRQAPMELVVSAESEEGFEAARKRYTLLVLGKEHDNRADTLILCNLRIDKGSVRLLSFPRDTRVLTVHNEHQVLDKISHAFRWGGLDLVKHSTQEFLRVPIDHTVVIDLVLFRKIIDTIGGVEVDVEKDLKYVDKAGGLTIDINKGPQVLMGHDAEGYVRYRSDGLGDLGRIERQKKFITAFLEKLKSLSLFGWDSFRILGRLPGFVMDLYQDVETSIPVDLFVKFLLAFHDMDKSSVGFKTLEGSGQYIHVAGYKKKINFYMSSSEEVATSRQWFLGDEELDPEEFSNQKWFSQFPVFQGDTPPSGKESRISTSKVRSVSQPESATDATPTVNSATGVVYATSP